MPSFARWSAFSIWLLVIALFLCWMGFIPDRNDQTTGLLEDLKVFNQTRTRYAEWKRDEAVEFGLNQVATTINYLFIAAAAILTFVGKTVFEPSGNGKHPRPLRPSVLLLLKHSAIGCILSLCFGFFARLYFNNISDMVSFSIYDECGVASLFQIISFCVGSMFLGLAISKMVDERLKSSPGGEA
jgi:hypothetical protein